jgi:hypothetical protein
MAHIFISYSKQNIDFVRYLRALLESEGFGVWVDEARLAPSARWWKTIEDNIEACSVFIVVMSPDAKESDWVEREILLAEKLRRPVFPILLAGDPWSRLANIQYEDMRLGLRAKFSAHFLDSMRSKVLPYKSTAINFTIDHGDILEVEADVIALKYAQHLYGADLAVTNALKAVGAKTPKPAAGKFALVESKGGVSAPHVLFIGTPILRFFGYQQIREFAASALSHVKQNAPKTRHIAMTLHGPGRSLDPAEALLSQFAGLRDAMLAGDVPPHLERITITEFNTSRVDRLRSVLDEALAKADYAARFETGWGYQLALDMDSTGDQSEPAAIETAGRPKDKPHAFVVLAPVPEMEDVFYYGVQSSVHALGLLCERSEGGVFTGDILEQIEARIRSASVVIADLTGADPMVYLQLGLAWGNNRPTILLAKQGEHIHFDTLGQSILSYNRIKDLETALTQQLDEFKVQGLL